MIKSDHRPLYLQVIDKIKNDIEEGIYEAGERLPSEFELSKQLGVSRATLREALRILEDENVITRRHGVGTFICSKPIFSSGIEELFSITDMIKRGNKKPGTIFVSSELVTATEDDIEKFQIEDLDEVMIVKRVRTANDDPVVYCLDKIPKVYLRNREFSYEQSIFERLEKEGTSISYAITQIEPIGYHEEVSEILRGPQTALLVLRQMHYDDQERPILYSINYFRADQFKFHVLRKRV
ncbi:GntR family transcriptional regulator [Anaerobacillus alkalilacustris]|uniref:GntR family transcriptional regulator n=1 Tax=Anaerobacillus alkalilacustris TaxID=393763 RepID=A0A1S2LNW2_9BACI|nr:GntR family transcriptional regulator [Anaerobacillus alkalilacustris]OIJ13105.1 GntR family transcriptional regulator [Anaerobacillus alkalilacustris]